MNVLPAKLMAVRTRFIRGQEGTPLYRRYRASFSTTPEAAAFWWGTMLIPLEQIPTKATDGTKLIELDPTNPHHRHAWENGRRWFMEWLNQ